MLCLLVFCSSVFAAPAGKAVSVSGSVLVRNEDGGSSAKTLKPGDQIEKGTVINTASNGNAKILMSDKTIMDLGASTLFKVDEYQLNSTEDRKITMSLPYGKMRAAVGNPVGAKGRFTIRTRSATMGVRGTEFVVATDIDEFMAPAPPPPAQPQKPSAPIAKPSGPKTQITVISGKVEVTTQSVEKTKPSAATGIAGAGTAAAIPKLKTETIALTAGSQMTTTAASKDSETGELKPVETPKIVKLSTEEIQVVKQEAKQEDKTFVQAISIDRSDKGGGSGGDTFAAILDTISLPTDIMPDMSNMGFIGSFNSTFGMYSYTFENKAIIGMPVSVRVTFNK